MSGAGFSARRISRASSRFAAISFGRGRRVTPRSYFARSSANAEIPAALRLASCEWATLLRHRLSFRSTNESGGLGRNWEARRRRTGSVERFFALFQPAASVKSRLAGVLQVSVGNDSICSSWTASRSVCRETRVGGLLNVASRATSPATASGITVLLRPSLRLENVFLGVVGGIRRRLDSVSSK